MNSTETKPNKIKTDKERAQRDAHRDPLSGRAGAHPVGAGVGAAAGGAAVGAAAGAAGGAIGGPIGAATGAVIGAAVGGVGGGLAGKAIAEDIDPTVEHGFWREEYTRSVYFDTAEPYETFAPAYQYGWESRARYDDRDFADVESDLERAWPKARGASKLNWNRAKAAVRDAWDRVAHRHQRLKDRD